MKIEYKRVKSRFRKCLYPYEEYHSPGFHIDCNTGRRLISLLSIDRGKTTVSYAKYLWEVSHKRKVKKGYEVDHIDGDCTNDTLDNLQVISKKENLLKQSKDIKSLSKHRKNYIITWCPICNKKFRPLKGSINFKKFDKGKYFKFCSADCYLYYKHHQLKGILKPQKYKIPKQVEYEPKNEYEDFKKFSKPLFVKKKVKLCDCGKIIKGSNLYCSKECLEKYRTTKNGCKVKINKKKFLKYCKISLKKYGRYNYSWIGTEFNASANLIKNRLHKYGMI